MADINAGTRNALQQGLSAATKTFRKEMEFLTGARSPAVIAAASALGRAWRLELNTPAGDIRQSPKSRRFRGSPSKPGEPPHRLSGITRKSVKTGVVDGVRRVGSGYFKLRLLEDGVTATVTRRRKDGARGKRRAAVSRSYTFTIAPRPSAQRALDRAAPQMTDVFVSKLSSDFAEGA